MGRTARISKLFPYLSEQCDFKLNGDLRLIIKILESSQQKANAYKPDEEDERLDERLALRFDREVLESLELRRFSGDEDERDDLRSLCELDVDSFLSCAGELYMKR